MDILDEEILNLWSLLDKHKVLYIMVGGFATTLHGYKKTIVSDLEIWIKDTLENLQNLRFVLIELNVGDFENIEHISLNEKSNFITLNSGFELDIMTSIKGFEQIRFDECYKISPIASIEEIPVRFLHINQLIEAKKASGRERDLLDVAELEKIRDRNK